MAEPAKTMNLDVVGLCNRMSRFIKEVLTSQSANASVVVKHDLLRMKSFSAAIRKYHEIAVSEYSLDAVETHPTEFELQIPELSEVETVENDAIKDWARLLVIAAKELVNSQSSRLSSGLISHDSKRLLEFMNRLDAFVTNYIETQLPLDTPETVPSRESVKKGATGIG